MKVYNSNAVWQEEENQDYWTEQEFSSTAEEERNRNMNMKPCSTL